MSAAHRSLLRVRDDAPSGSGLVVATQVAQGALLGDFDPAAQADVVPVVV
jgi:hypothetical protein